MSLHNEGRLDRSVRVLLGVVLVTLALFGPRTPWGWIGIVPLATGLGGFCPMYRLVGIRTCALRAAK